MTSNMYFALTLAPCHIKSSPNFPRSPIIWYLTEVSKQHKLNYLHQHTRGISRNNHIPTLWTKSASNSFWKKSTKFWNLKNYTANDILHLHVRWKSLITMIKIYSKKHAWEYDSKVNWRANTIIPCTNLSFCVRSNAVFRDPQCFSKYLQGHELNKVLKD